MGTPFKRWELSKLEEFDLEGEAEQRYLDECEERNAEILRQAQVATCMYWLDTDEYVMQIAELLKPRRDKIEDALFSYKSELFSATDSPRLLTDELVEKRRCAMLEACRLYREAANHICGKMGEELLRRVDEYEAKANALEKYEDHFNPSRYYR